MKKTILLLALILSSNSLFAQLPAHLEGKMTYPVFDFHPWVGVAKAKVKKLKYNKDLEYKIAVDVYNGVSDSTQIIRPFREVARTFNLNVANGVPKRKVKMAVVIHAGAIRAVLNDEAYQERYGVPNPNTAAIEAMKKEGIEFYVCAQNLAFSQTDPESLLKAVDVATSAKTAFITLDQMGYTYMNVNRD